MLTPADAALAKRDPALPGLATLLDASALQAALELPAPAPLRAAYVRYKFATSCLVGYRLGDGETPISVYARTQRPETLDKLVKGVNRARDDRARGRGARVLADLSLAVHPLPDDRRMRALPELLDAERREPVLRRALPDRPELWGAGLRILRYKPERRLVAELRAADGGRALLKAFSGEAALSVALAGARAFSRVDRLAQNGGGLRVAAPLGRSRGRHLLVLEWLDGDALDATRLASAMPELAAAAGTALAALHATPVADRLRTHTLETELTRLRRAVQATAEVCPDVARNARRLGREIAGRLADLPGPIGPLHGDFSPDQLLDGPSLAVVDLDQAGVGPVGADLGSFLGALHVDAPTAGGDEAAAAFVESYRRAVKAPVPSEAVAAWTAAAVLRVAPEPFRHRDPEWPARVRARVDRAAAVLRAA